VTDGPSRGSGAPPPPVTATLSESGGRAGAAPPLYESVTVIFRTGQYYKNLLVILIRDRRKIGFWLKMMAQYCCQNASFGRAKLELRYNNISLSEFLFSYGLQESWSQQEFKNHTLVGLESMST
jgi:hypothetical protein